jgi:hypothetical protein
LLPGLAIRSLRSEGLSASFPFRVGQPLVGENKGAMACWTRLVRMSEMVVRLFATDKTLSPDNRFHSG